MNSIIWRWYYDECGKTTVSGIVLADDFDEAVEKTKVYLLDRFNYIKEEMHFILPDDTNNPNASYPTLYVWNLYDDDDYQPGHTDCILVNYI